MMASGEPHYIRPKEQQGVMYQNSQPFSFMTTVKHKHSQNGYLKELASLLSPRLQTSSGMGMDQMPQQHIWGNSA